MLALCFAAGIALADRFSAPLEWWWVATCLLWAGCWLWENVRVRAILVLVAAVGGLNLVQRSEPLSPHDLRHVVAHRVPALVTVRGTLVDTPTLQVRMRDGEPMLRTAAWLELTAIQREGQWIPARGRVIVWTAGELGPGYHGGQGVEVEGVLSEPASAAAPGLFDYRRWLARRGVHYQLRVDSVGDWRVCHPTVPVPWTDRFEAWASGQLERGLPSDLAVGLLRAMTLGWRTALTDEVSEVFMRSGTMHVFAISGLHIGLLSGILLTLFQVVRLPRAACAVLVIPLIWFYTAATGWQPSAVRATTMMTVVALSWALVRPGDLLNSLGWAALVILAWEPRQLFHAGFQLSFAVVASLALWMPRIEEWVHERTSGDSLRPPELESVWRRWWRSAVRRVGLAVGTSWAAWVGSWPLIAWHFHLVTPVTLLANLVVVPCAALALMSCLGSWMAGWVWETAGVWFNHSAWLWMWVMQKASEWAARLPWGSWYVRPPAMWEVAGFYAWVAWALTGGRSGLWAWRLWLAVGVLGSGLMVGTRWYQSRSWEAVLLPSREAVVLWSRDPGSGIGWLVNCGNASDVEFVVKPFLRAQGQNRVSAVGVSPALAAYGGGLPAIVEGFRPSRVLTAEGVVRSRVIREVLADSEKRGIAVERLGRGSTVGVWRVLHPAAADRFPRAAEAAWVLWGQWRGVDVLWVGGLGRDGLKVLLEREPGLRAHGLILGGTSLDPGIVGDLLQRTGPQWVLFADGLPGRPVRESRGVRAELARYGVPFWCTSEVGAVCLQVDRRRWTLRSVRGELGSGPIDPKGRGMIPGGRRSGVAGPNGTWDWQGHGKGTEVGSDWFGRR